MELPTTKNPNKRNISLTVFLLVCFLFSVKYLDRITSYSMLISLAIVLFYFLLWKKRNLLAVYAKRLKIASMVALAVFFICSLLVFAKIPVENLNVDRWSVISSFWDSYFKGGYVYLAQSNVGNYPGPMPFYFILALPFYLIGELGIFSIIGVVLFYLILEKTTKNSVTKFIALILVLTSIPYLWEVVCRSNIFLNGTLILGTLILFLNQKAYETKRNIVIGILIGLALSTRNVFVIPFAIAFVFSLKAKRITVQQTLVIGTIAFITFCLTFVPFVWNHFSEFKTMNPFIIQSSFLMPFQYTITFIVMAFVAGFYCKSINDVYFYSSLILCCTILFYFLYWICKLGYQETFVNSSYLILFFVCRLHYTILLRKMNLRQHFQ